MFARVSSAFTGLFVLANIAASNALVARQGGSIVCSCPTDLYGDYGTLINQDETYQCAYPDGSCVWTVQVRVLNVKC